MGNGFPIQRVINMNKNWKLERHYQATPHKLGLGGFNCKVTIDELNEWTEFMEDKPHGPAYAKLTSYIIRAEFNNAPNATIDDYIDQREAILNEQYKTGKQWYLDVIKPREEEYELERAKE